MIQINHNLYKWKKRQDDKCHLCNVTEDVTHLLFECRYAKVIWDKINDISNHVIDAEDVFLGSKLSNDDIFIVSSISYFIFKRWVNFSYSGTPRDCNTAIEMLKIELKYIHMVYTQLKNIHICHILSNIIELL